MVKEEFSEPVSVVRLWVHECERVFLDRMTSDADRFKFNEYRVNTTKKYFDDVNLV
jgi:dynein heavy chain, axonemal